MIKLSQHIINTIGWRRIPFLCLLCAFIASWTWAAQPPQKQVAAKEGAKAKRVGRLTPQIPSADRNQRNKVFLENADELIYDEQRNPDFQVLKGNVRFRRGDMFMYCDSAYFYDRTSSLDAFGHVHMTQADTLDVYADVLHYYGEQQVAQLRYNVKLENRSTIVTTDSLDYDVQSNVGHYFNGGQVYEKKSKTTLTSSSGLFEMDSKQTEFVSNVVLVNPQYEIYTNQLNYNLRSRMAQIVDATQIVSDGNTIHTTSGWYNTGSEDGTLYQRSQVHSNDGKTLVGDTVYYNRNRNYGWARGNAIIIDEKNKVTIDGDYGYHDEVTHYSFVTRNARAKEYSQKDTLYLHADTLCTMLDDDSIRVIKAFNKVRFYRSDIQGVCDSLQMSQADTIINLYRHAVLWSDNRQIEGEEINVHLNDSTADWATMPNFGLLAEHVGEDYYDQLSGKKMKALFENKEIKQLNADGNVQLILFPQEDDSTYNKMVSAESSHLVLNLKPKQEIEKVVMWPEVSGTVTPLFLAKKSTLYLPQFRWLDAIRPKSPDDIFGNRKEMEQLMSEPNNSSRHRISL